MIATLDLGLVKLATDVGLGCALLFLGTRIKKPSLAPQALGKLRSLEQSIKGLLAEAEQASVGLSEDLLKRRKELETTLEDVKEAEKKLSRDIVEADEKSKTVIISLQSAERALKSVQTAQQTPQRTQVQSQQQAPTQQSTSTRRAQVPLSQQISVEEEYPQDQDIEYESDYAAEEIVAPPSTRHLPPRQQTARPRTQDLVPELPTRQSRVRPSAPTGMQIQQHGFDQEPPSFGRQASRVTPAHVQANPANYQTSQEYYSVPVQHQGMNRAEYNRPDTSHHGLAGEIERQVSTPVQSEALQKIQQAAQQTSNSANALHAEAIKAALQKRRAPPVAQLQQQDELFTEENDYIQAALNQMPQGRDAREEKSESDSRLGVLSGIRRTTQVV